MKAKIITYSTEKLTPTQRSILSKRINGYLDKSNKAKYKYKREGTITKLPHIKISNKTFIIKEKDFPLIHKTIKQLKATIKVWNIEIKKL